MKAKSVIEEQLGGISIATPFASDSRPLLTTSHTSWSSSAPDLCKHNHIAQHIFANYHFVEKKQIIAKFPKSQGAFLSLQHEDSYTDLRKYRNIILCNL